MYFSNRLNNNLNIYVRLQHQIIFIIIYEVLNNKSHILYCAIFLYIILRNIYQLNKLNRYNRHLVGYSDFYNQKKIFITIAYMH